MAKYVCAWTKIEVRSIWQCSKIDLEENLDANFAKIRKIMEFVIRECRSEHEVSPIAKKLMTDKVMDAVKGITMSDVISTALGIAGLIPR